MPARGEKYNDQQKMIFNTAKPFLNWAGVKTQLIFDIKASLPNLKKEL